MLYSFHLVSVLGVLLGFGWLLQRLSRVEFHEALPVSLAWVVTVIYGAGLLNILPAGALGLYGVGLGACGVAVVLALRDGKAFPLFWREGHYKPLAAWLLIVTAFYLRVAPSYFSFWDDFSNWGPLISSVYHNHGFATPEGDLAPLPHHLVHYVRLIGAVHYVFLKVLPLTEGHNLFIAGLLPLTFISVVLVKRSFWISLMLGFLALAPAVLLTSVLTSVYLDGLMGLLFGVMMAYVVINDQRGRGVLFTLLPFLIIVPNLKEVGFWICYGVLISYTIKLLALRQLKSMGQAGVLFFLYTIPFLSEKVWMVYLSQFPTHVLRKSKLSWEALFQKLIHGMSSAEGAVIHQAFFKAVGTFFMCPSMIVTYGIVAVSWYLTRTFHPEKLKEFKIYILSLCVLFLMYMLFRFSLYHTHFLYSEAIEAAHAHRYFSAFSLVFGVLGCAYIRQAILAMTATDRARFQKQGVLLGFIGFWIVAWGLVKRPVLHLSQERVVFESVATELQKLKPQSQNILIGFNEFTILNCHQLKHDLSNLGLPNTAEHTMRHCHAQAGHPDPKPLGDVFYNQLHIKNFNDRTATQRDAEKFDMVYLATPSVQALAQVEKKTGVRLKPAAHYVLYVKKGRFVQDHRGEMLDPQKPHI